MRIAQLAGWYSPTSGGIRTVVHRLGDGYRATGHETVLVVPGVGDADRPGRVELRSVAVPRSGGYRVVVRPSALGAVLDRHRPDVVELHDKAWLPAVRRWADTRGVPVVVVSHERLDRTLPLLLPWLPGGLAEAVSTRVRGMVHQKADAIVTCSAFAGAEYPGAVHVPLGVDLKTFTPALRCAVVPGVHLVLASRLAREKRPDLAVATLAALRRRGIDARLTVLGSGPLLASMQAAARNLPVHFAGFTADRQALAAVIGAADVVLAPGPAETFGLSALEALACGTPVVATRGAAVAELVQQAPIGAGFAAAPDGEAFAAGVQALLRCPEQQRRRAARQIAERHPWSRTVDGMLAVHCRVLSDRTAGGSRRPEQSGRARTQSRPAARRWSASIAASSSGAGPSTGTPGATSCTDNVATREAGNPQPVRHAVSCRPDTA